VQCRGEDEREERAIDDQILRFAGVLNKKIKNAENG
jgi:hypothetical protein